MAILTKLAEAKKLDKSITVYYNYICMLADTLTSIGQPLTPTQFTAYLLKGLDGDYDSLVENINGRDTPLSPRELYSRLLSTEQRVEARRASETFSDASVNAAFRGRPYRPSTGDGSGSSKQNTSKPPSSGPLPSSNNSRAHTGGGGGGGGGRRWHTADGNRPLCQLCNTLGHVSARCFKRFDQDFLGIGNDQNNLQRQVSMVMHGKGKTQTYSVESPWIMDTGATDHLTGELDKLAMKEPYQGNDRVHTANGQGMRISHIGQSSLSTNTSKPLHLKNVLYVPQVTRNLLSASKLARDNNVFIEFHPYDLFVKDRDSKDIILSGRCRGGLYPVGGFPAKQVFNSVRVSSSKWHCRLGHPASPVVQHVLHRHALPIESSSNKNTLVCDACQQGKSHILPFSLSSHVIETPT